MVRILRSHSGFTLVELIIVMAMFVVVIAVAGDSFNRIVSRSLGITRTAESNIAGVVGLELMRVDLESAGYGLPWSFSGPINYNEATAAPGLALNDSGRVYLSDPNQNNIPRAVMSTNNIVSANASVVFNGTDVLTVRGHSVATNAAAKRWSYIESAVMPNANPSPSSITWSSENLTTNDRVLLVQPVENFKATKKLIVNATTGVWTTKFNNYTTISKPPIYNDAEKKTDAFIIYGIDSDTDLRMPFNRADYYLRRPAAGEQGWIRLPERCNPSTGVLFKAVVGHTSGAYQELPLLECVLDFQVVYELVTPGTTMLTDSADISAMAPSEVRDQVKAIKAYILTHDGGFDRNYTYPNATIGVGPGNGIISGSGRTYNFAANGVTNWQNYRWRVYQIVARPHNLAAGIAK